MISLDIEQELRDMMVKFYEKHQSRIFGSCVIQIEDGSFRIISNGETVCSHEGFLSADEVEDAMDSAYEEGWTDGYLEGRREKHRRS